MTSSAAWTMRPVFSSSSLPNSLLANAAAFFSIPNPRTTSMGMMSSPIEKWMSDRAVWAPQYRSAGTSISPMLSVSTRVCCVSVAIWLVCSANRVSEPTVSCIGPLEAAQGVVGSQSWLRIACPPLPFCHRGHRGFSPSPAPRLFLFGLVGTGRPIRGYKSSWSECLGAYSVSSVATTRRRPRRSESGVYHTLRVGCRRWGAGT